MQEFRAGRVQGDVLGNSPEPLLYLKQQGVLGQYRSAETKNLLPGAWDNDGFWSGITTDLLVTGFNPRLLSKSAVRKHDELTQFKGQIAVNRGVPSLTGMVSLRGESKAWLISKTSQQDLRLVESYSHTINMMAAGNTHSPDSCRSKLEAMKRKEAPVDWLPAAQPPGDHLRRSRGENRHPAAQPHRFPLSLKGNVLSGGGKIPLERGKKPVKGYRPAHGAATPMSSALRVATTNT
jgi:hypothetical protein